ncbi:MAG: DNA polymerase III subunit [Parcubacteria group bacterium]|jgi:DNA polymerase-3 subunit delta'
MKIIGHQKIINLLDKAIAKNAVSHAYLFHGPAHAGKFTVAEDFAKKLTKREGFINPDLVIVRPETEEKKGIVKKHDIRIEQIRELQHQLNLSAQWGKYKVAIIDEAERLNKTAQNSLLKILEEAGSGVVLILVADDIRRLLPTILSRCQKIKFGTVSETELRQEVTIENEQEIGDLIFWSLGRPGLMLNLLKDEDELNFRKDSARELEKLFSQNVSERFSLAEEMSKDTAILAEKINIWLFIFREAILGRKKFTGADQAKILKLIDKTEKSLEIIKDTNSNARLVLENLFLEF